MVSIEGRWVESEQLRIQPEIQSQPGSKERSTVGLPLFRGKNYPTRWMLDDIQHCQWVINTPIGLSKHLPHLPCHANVMMASKMGLRKQ